MELHIGAAILPPNITVHMSHYIHPIFPLFMNAFLCSLTAYWDSSVIKQLVGMLYSVGPGFNF